MQNLTYIITALFIGLKLTNQIDWSWLLVLSPLPIGFVIQWFFVSVFIFLGNLAGEANEKRRNREAKDALRAFAEDQLKNLAKKD
jgi:hypothetical protein